MRRGIHVGSIPKAIIAGIAAILLLTTAATAVLAALLRSGRVPLGVMMWLGPLVALLAAFAGAFLCSRITPKARLPVCAACGVGYLLLAMLLRGVLFRGLGGVSWMIAACVILGSVLASLLPSGGRRPGCR